MVALVIGINYHGGLDSTRASVAKVMPFLKVKPPEAQKPEVQALPREIPQAEMTALNRDALGRLNEQLEEKSKACKAREEDLRVREFQLETWESRIAIDREDLKREYDRRDAELKAEKLKLEKEGTRIAQESARLENRVILFTQEERESLKRAAAVVEKMEPEKAAEAVTKMWQGGQDTRDTAVKELSLVNQRNAAKILDAIQDPAVKADMMERLSFLRPQGQKVATQ